MSPKRKSLLARLELAKRRALADLYYFDKHVLGYSKMVEHVHKKLCKFTQRKIERSEAEQSIKLILMPRGSYKSSCVTIGYSLWRLANNPDTTILITNEKLDKSKEFMKEIKWHITDNKTFKTLFGDWSCERVIGKKWSETKIDIKPRHRSTGSPSIEVSSVDSSETGKHVDLIICDDLVGRSNSTTKDQLQKVIEYWKELGSVLNPGGEMIVIGTRWDYRDLYQYILDIRDELGELAKIDVLIEKAERDDGTLLFPEVLSKQFLRQRRIEQGTYFYNCQYQNTPVGRENALIRKEDILKYSDKIQGMDAELFLRNCKHYITVDLAFTESKKSDSTVVLVNAVNPRTGIWYIRDYRVFKTTDPSKVIELLFELNEQYKPLVFGIEKNNYMNWLQWPLEMAMRKRNIFFNIEPLAHYGKANNKELRLRKIPPRFAYHRCYIHTSMIELEDQLLTLTYDGAKGHDDLLDALAMQEEIVKWGINEVANKYDNEESEVKRETLTERLNRIYGGLQDYYEDEWMYV